MRRQGGRFGTVVLVIALGALGADGALLSSCGGSEPVPWSATVDGTFLGRTFVPMSATSKRDNGLGQTIVSLDTTPNVCPLLEMAIASANGSELFFNLSTWTGTTDTPVAAPGTFSTYSIGLPPAGYAWATMTWLDYDAKCNIANTYDLDGSVTVTRIDGAVIEGTFQIGSGANQLTGSFSAPICDALQAVTVTKCQ